MSIFKSQTITKSDGTKLDWVIDCDDFTDTELGIFAKLIISKYPDFFLVTHPNSHYGSCVPRLAKAIADIKIGTPLDQAKYILIVDDVLTSGKSMEDLAIGYREKRTWDPRFQNIVGAVIFARGPCPAWITPLFSMQEYNNAQ